MDVFQWAGLCLSFLAAFLLSLFHISLSASSKIFISRFLETRKKEYRTRVLQIYDEIKIAVECARIFFLIAFLIYLYVFFPRSRFWPLWLFLASVGIYIFFLDLVPRLIVYASRKGVLGILLPSYRFFHRAMAPVMILSRKLQRKEEKEEDRETTDEELETFIDEAREEGIIEKEEGLLLRSVVEFGDTLVREIMTPRLDMVCCRKDATIETLRELIIREKYSRIPVYKDRIDNIEGIVMAKDLLELSDEAHKTGSIEPLIRPVYFVPESMRVAELLRELQKRKQKMAIVVDEHGGVSGLVTMEDLVEEIVGEIQDEYDTDEEIQITQNGPLDYMVSGDVEVEDIEELFDMDLAEEDFITISGLITHGLGRVPRVGERVEIKGLLFEVLEADEKRIRKLRIKKKPEGEKPRD